MRSMTGFGAATSADANVSVTVEVRSVNHRFLQVKSRLGSELAEREGEVERLAKKHLERGSVNLTAKVEHSGGVTRRTIWGNALWMNELLFGAGKRP